MNFFFGICQIFLFICFYFFSFLLAQDTQPQDNSVEQSTEIEQDTQPQDNSVEQSTEIEQDTQPQDNSVEQSTEIEQDTQPQDNSVEQSTEIEQDTQPQDNSVEQSIEIEQDTQPQDNSVEQSTEIEQKKSKNIEILEPTYDNVIKVLNVGAYFEAQIMLENLLEKNPNNSDLMILFAELAYRQKRYNEAFDIYEKIVMNKSKMEKKDLLLYADTLIILKEKEKAVTVLKILAEQLGDVVSLYRLGEIWLELGDSKKALNAFNAAYLADSTKAPKDFEELKRTAVELYSQVLKVEEERRNQKRLRREKEKAAKKRRDQLNGLKKIASMRRKNIGHEKFTSFGNITEEQRQEELVKIFAPSKKRSEKINPEALSYFFKANVSLQKKEFDQAIVQYQHAIDKQADFAEAYYHKGVVLYLKNKYDDALKAFENALKNKAFFPRAFYWQGRAYEKKKFLNKAFDSFIGARKMAIKSGDVFILFDSFRTIRNLVARGATSKFQIDPLPKQVVLEGQVNSSRVKDQQFSNPTTPIVPKR